MDTVFTIFEAKKIKPSIPGVTH